MAKKTAFKIIFASACLAATCYARGAAAATLFLTPATLDVVAGQSFTVHVDVSSADQAMNAVQGTIAFPVGAVNVVSISKAASIINLWVQDPSFSNQDGQVNFQGVVVNPGFQGVDGDVIDIVFRAERSGRASLAFSAGSVLANDGKGTNILSAMSSAAVTVAAAATGTPTVGTTGVSFSTPILSSPAINDGAWYSGSSVTFSWNLPPDVSAVSYALSNNPDYELPTTEQPVLASTTYDLSNTPDGMWYFFLSFKEPTGWTPAAVKQIGIDRTPPEPFTITRLDTDLEDVRPSFIWNAVDSASGIDHYLVKIGDGDWFDPSSILQGSSYILPPQSPTAERTLVVRAYDRAGNFRSASTTFVVRSRISGFLESSAWYLLLVVFVVGILIYILSWQIKMRRELHDLQEKIGTGFKALENELEAGAGTKEAVTGDVKKLESDTTEEVKQLEEHF